MSFVPLSFNELVKGKRNQFCYLSEKKFSSKFQEICLAENCLNEDTENKMPK